MQDAPKAPEGKKALPATPDPVYAAIAVARAMIHVMTSVMADASNPHGSDVYVANPHGASHKNDARPCDARRGVPDIRAVDEGVRWLRGARKRQGWHRHGREDHFHFFHVFFLP